MDAKGNETEDPIKFWNENCFSEYEYKQYTAQHKNHTYIEYVDCDPPTKPQGKPRVPWFRFVRLPKPNKVAKENDIFDEKYENNQRISEIFIREMEIAKNQRRIVVLNPGMMLQEYQRFQTLNIIIRSIKRAKSKVFIKPTEYALGKPYDQWTPHEKNQDKMLLVIRELSDITASQLKTDSSGQSTVAKKALAEYIKKGRQLGTGLIGDYQRFTDVFEGIRDHADVFWLKAAPERMFGELGKWLFPTLQAKREKEMAKNGGDWQKALQKWPRLDRLKKEWVYALKHNDEIELVESQMPNFHHWSSDDDFSTITGIHWKYKEIVKTVDKTGTSNTEQIPDDTFEYIASIRNSNKKQRKIWKEKYGIVISDKVTWTEIYELYKKLVADKTITTNVERKTSRALQVWYNREQLKS